MANNNSLSKRLLYQQNDTGLCLLSDLELQGNYPNWFSDAEVNQYNSHWARPSTFEQVKGFVESLSNDPTKLVFAVYALKEAEHIGNISLQAIDPFNQSAELAFLFGEKAYWNKGYAGTAAKLVLSHAFAHLNLKRVYLGCLATNTAMNKLALKLGFVEEGTRRKAAFNQGAFVDIKEYGLLNDEYQTSTDC